ncbi:MAG: hypothetical protein KAX39_04595 [candidate division Zixibacteria bacterium]|nr:hypothetical protein [candidate division Zixibacteria bacterium]
MKVWFSPVDLSLDPDFLKDNGDDLSSFYISAVFSSVTPGFCNQDACVNFILSKH